jgi:hypothetical protein
VAEAAAHADAWEGYDLEQAHAHLLAANGLRERKSSLRSARESGADQAVAAFNEPTGHDYGPLDFVDYQGSRSLADFAMEAARPAYPRVPDITRDELCEIVRRVRAADPDVGYYLRLLEANLPHPRVSDLLFHPAPVFEAATAEQLAHMALSYRPIDLCISDRHIEQM